MISPYDLIGIKRALKQSEEEGTLDAIKARIKMEEDYTDREYICDITWSVEDIQEIRQEWTFEQCQDAASHVGSVLQDRSTEEGWEILECALSMYEYDQQKESA